MPGALYQLVMFDTVRFMLSYSVDGSVPYNAGDCVSFFFVDHEDGVPTSADYQPEAWKLSVLAHVPDRYSASNQK